MVRKDATAAAQDATKSDEQARAPVAAPGQQQQQFPAVAPSTVVNIAVHSLLMVTVPFALFFASHFGGLDSLFQLTGRSVPSQQTKTYLGAGLAVLGVNLVIASFVVSAFREQPASSKKQD